jgi:uncharacterized phage infection (PIP) family protein YhgE
MLDSMNEYKEVISITVAAVSLLGVFGGLAVSRHKIKELVDNAPKIKDSIDKLKTNVTTLKSDTIRKAESSDLKLLKQKFEQLQKEMNEIKEKETNQEEVLTQIRLGMVAITKQMENMSTMLKDIGDKNDD